MTREILIPKFLEVRYHTSCFTFRSFSNGSTLSPSNIFRLDPCLGSERSTDLDLLLELREVPLNNLIIINTQSLISLVIPQKQN